MNIFEEIKQLDIDTQNELAVFDSEFESSEFEQKKIADEAVDKFLDILETHLGG